MSTIKQRAELRERLRELKQGWDIEEWIAAALDAAPRPILAESVALEVIQWRRRDRAREARELRRRGLSLTCATCGRGFVGSRSDQRHCSHACRQRTYRERVTARPPQPTG